MPGRKGKTLGPPKVILDASKVAKLRAQGHGWKTISRELLRIAQEARKSGSENPRTQNSRTTAVKTRLDSARRPQRERKGCVGLETKSVA